MHRLSILINPLVHRLFESINVLLSIKVVFLSCIFYFFLLSGITLLCWSNTNIQNHLFLTKVTKYLTFQKHLARTHGTRTFAIPTNISDSLVYHKNGYKQICNKFQYPNSKSMQTCHVTWFNITMLNNLQKFPNSKLIIVQPSEIQM